MGDAGSSVVAAAFRHITKRFGAFTALEDISLDIYENEFFTLLGPSGCGKTTLLRLLAGFEPPTSGHIEIFGGEVAHLPPNRRPVNTVFQHYALFPHMSVRDNVAFALKMLGTPREECRRVRDEALRLVHMEAFADRMPEQLSGGQKQRVALARALAPRPKVLLLDEPLSALDLKLRQAMRWELKTLQRETGITFVFVTHDQEEALAMSDRIAVLSDGAVQQLGAPSEIYEYPRNRFVADFIGESNLIEARVAYVTEDNADLIIEGGAGIRIRCDERLAAGDKVTLSVRPERILFNAERTADTNGTLSARVSEQVYLGNAVEFRLQLGASEIVARAPRGGVRGQLSFETGQEVVIGFEADAVRVLRS
ncbi:ABC transporter ATP-binding protein [Afifella aestuarii]|uniref:ABC transporter ATP-binding protein n=1 Tax=Afifella aestuarii TaxID=1909496 RepID=UPI000FE3D895|nr:ABC transporter ATP-binding protein [Afifella aestuarii]